MIKKQKLNQKNHGPTLKPGDCVALISPAGKIDRKKIEDSKKALQELGFFVSTYPRQALQDSFFSASDIHRAEELSWAFSEPAIKAIFCCRGGYGSSRALRLISQKQIQKWRPKIFVGYSDITYIHHWLYNHLGWRGVHGPLVGYLSIAQMKRMLHPLQQPRQIKEQWNEVRILRKGVAKGRLFGGNLSLFQVDGPAQLPKEKMILAIEEVNEDFYRIDRSLQMLLDAGYKKYIEGIIVGSLHSCGKNDSRSFGLKRLQESFLSLTDGPVWWKARFGHGLKNQRLLFLGQNVKINSKAIEYFR